MEFIVALLYVMVMTITVIDEMESVDPLVRFDIKSNYLRTDGRNVLCLDL